MKTNTILWLFLSIAIIHTAVGCGVCSPNGKRRRRRDIHTKILSEIDSLMKQAKDNNPDLSATIDKCIAAEEAIGDILSKGYPPSLREAAETFLVKINEWYYHEDRQAIEYYNLLENTFPNIDAIHSLTQSNFGTCFNFFVELHASYEQYRNEQTQSEYAAKYAENDMDNTKEFMTEEGGMPEAAYNSPMHPQGLDTADEYQIYY